MPAAASVVAVDASEVSTATAPLNADTVKRDAMIQKLNACAQATDVDDAFTLAIGAVQDLYGSKDTAGNKALAWRVVVKALRDVGVALDNRGRDVRKPAEEITK